MVLSPSQAPRTEWGHGAAGTQGIDLYEPCTVDTPPMATSRADGNADGRPVLLTVPSLSPGELLLMHVDHTGWLLAGPGGHTSAWYVCTLLGGQ